MSKQLTPDDYKVVIDFDQAIEKYNKQNPENTISRKDIFEIEGLTKTSIYNFKKGKVSSVFKTMFCFLDRTGLDLKDLLSVECKNKKIY